MAHQRKIGDACIPCSLKGSKTKMTKRINNISVGNAGEYFVAGELERHGFSVAVPMSNVELFDILAFERATHKQIAIQVKTTHGQKREWTLSAKNELIADKNVYYIFVMLNEMKTPEYFIVPSCTVANDIHASHARWLSSPGKQGQPHKDNSIRKFQDIDGTYKDRWDLLSK